MNAQTPYAETEALLAVLENDGERVMEILRDMLPNELKALAEQAERLADLATEVAAEKGVR